MIFLNKYILYNITIIILHVQKKGGSYIMLQSTLKKYIIIIKGHRVENINHK